MTDLSFGSIEIQPRERRLIVDGRDVALGPRALDVLVALAERAGSLVSKNDLLELVWPGVVVEENNLQVQVSTLRKLLGPEAIATIPGRGYRFTLSETSAAGREERSRLTPNMPRGARASGQRRGVARPVRPRRRRRQFGGPGTAVRTGHGRGPGPPLRFLRKSECSLAISRAPLGQRTKR